VLSWHKFSVVDTNIGDQGYDLRDLDFHTNPSLKSIIDTVFDWTASYGLSL
jgi:hypothetical protein